MTAADDDPPDVQFVRAGIQEIRGQHASLLIATALAVDDPEMFRLACLRAMGDALDVGLVYLHAAEIIADQLDVTRDDAIDNLRAALARFVARHGHLLDDDDPPPDVDTQPTWRPR